MMVIRGMVMVESRSHLLVGYPGSRRVFFIFRPLCKDIDHEFRRSSGRVSTQGTLSHANWTSI